MLAGVLVLALLLPACAAPAQPVTLPTTQPPKAEPAIRNSPSAIRNLQEAAHYYNRYHALAPDDLLGLKRLAEVCTALEQAGVEDESCREAAERVLEGQGDKETGGQGEGEMLHSPFSTLHSPASVLREVLEARTDDRRIVAELLGVPVEAVELGENLVEDGGFEEWVGGKPKGWMWSDMATGDPWNEGLFVRGQSTRLVPGGAMAARVHGLWVQSLTDLPGGRAGYWICQGGEETCPGISLEPNALYALVFYYSTVGTGDRGAGLWVSNNAEAFFAHERFLPPTAGTWHRLTVVSRNNLSFSESVQPLLRLWSIGIVAYDDVRLREIEIAGEISKSVSLPIFRTDSPRD